MGHGHGRSRCDGLGLAPARRAGTLGGPGRAVSGRPGRRQGCRWWRRWGGPSDDRGSGTVVVVALVAVVLVLGSGLGLLAGAHGATGQAQAAADLAALAGAAALPRSGLEQACAIAEETAARNGARVTACAGDGPQVLRVTVSRDSLGGAAVRSARAGPASARGQAEG
ncbi:Rv3654c family TadE-like protein [Cellulomonas soli]